jgi:hypothetical protein
MTTMEESIEIGCPPHVTEDDLRNYFFRRAVGQYGAPDIGLTWNPSDDVIVDGTFVFTPTANGSTELTVTVTYDAAELAADGGDEAGLHTLVRAHLAHIQGYCLMRRAAA